MKLYVNNSNNYSPNTHRLRIWTVLAEQRKRGGTPESLFRSGVVACTRIFEIGGHNGFQYINRLKT